MEELYDPTRKPEMPIREIETEPASGFAWLAGLLAILLGSVAGLILGGVNESPPLVIVSLVLLVLSMLGLAGLFVVNPNEAKVLQLFGAYRGTVRKSGLCWANPFYSKKAISVRVRNFESSRLKVNDRNGNP